MTFLRDVLGGICYARWCFRKITSHAKTDFRRFERSFRPKRGVIWPFSTVIALKPKVLFHCDIILRRYVYIENIDSRERVLLSYIERFTPPLKRHNVRHSSAGIKKRPGGRESRFSPIQLLGKFFPLLGVPLPPEAQLLVASLGGVVPLLGQLGDVDPLPSVPDRDLARNEKPLRGEHRDGLTGQVADLRGARRDQRRQEQASERS